MTGSGRPAQIEVFFNAVAGLGKAVAADLATQLENAGVQARVHAVPAAQLAQRIRSAARNADVVGVSGGDGTQMTAAGVLAGHRATLAPIPTGTLNHFARRIGLSDVDDAAAAILAGRTEMVPVGIADDLVFLNTATFGLYADVVRQREHLRPWLTKWPAAALALAGRLIRMRRLQVILEVEGTKLKRLTPLVWVGVGWGSFPRVHQAAERREQPDLEIVVLRPRGRFGIIPLGLRFLRHLRGRNRPVEDPALEVIHARSLLIRSREPIGVTLDGEAMRLQPPVFVGIVDNALRVVGAAE
ncbi:hypothetical protein BH23GEM6_BH23GEM6_01440 [soil metagenome]